MDRYTSKSKSVCVIAIVGCLTLAAGTRRRTSSNVEDRDLPGCNFGSQYTSKCMEHEYGCPDEDCCAMPADAYCEKGFDVRKGDSCADQGQVYTCCEPDMFTPRCQTPDGNGGFHCWVCPDDFMMCSDGSSGTKTGRTSGCSLCDECEEYYCGTEAPPVPANCDQYTGGGVVGTILFIFCCCVIPIGSGGGSGCAFCYAHSQRQTMLGEAREGKPVHPPSQMWLCCCGPCAIYYWEGCSGNFWIACCLWQYWGVCCWQASQRPQENGQMVGPATQVTGFGGPSYGQAYGQPAQSYGQPAVASAVVVSAQPVSGQVIQATPVQSAQPVTVQGKIVS